MNSVDVTNELHQLLASKNAQVQLSVPQLVEKVLSRDEGELTASGAVKAVTGKYTGRSPKDKYIVEEASVKDKVDWENNQPISEEVLINYT